MPSKLEKKGFNLKRWYAPFQKSHKKVRSDLKIPGIPADQSGQFIICNCDLLMKLLIVFPETLQTFFQYRTWTSQIPTQESVTSRSIHRSGIQP